MRNSTTGKIENIALIWGFRIFLALCAYFMLMSALGLNHITELRALNGVIMCYGIYKAIKASQQLNLPFNYFGGLMTGLFAAITASVLFATGGVIYLNWINPEFLLELQANEPLGQYMTVYSAPLKTFIEGSASGFLFSYTILQWKKEPFVQGGI